MAADRSKPNIGHVPKAAVHVLPNERSQLAERRLSGFTSQVLIFSITALGFLYLLLSAIISTQNFCANKLRW